MDLWRESRRTWEDKFHEGKCKKYGKVVRQAQWLPVERLTDYSIVLVSARAKTVTNLPDRPVALTATAQLRACITACRLPAVGTLQQIEQNQGVLILPILKLLLLSLQCEYILPDSVSDGGTNEETIILWDKKRRSYLRIIRFDPLEILGEKPGRKILKKQLGIHQKGNL